MGGGPRAPGGTPREGYMMLHCAAPQQSLMSASPVLATVGLLGVGSAFFSAREPAARWGGGRGREGKQERRRGEVRRALTICSRRSTPTPARPRPKATQVKSGELTCILYGPGDGSHLPGGPAAFRPWLLTTALSPSPVLFSSPLLSAKPSTRSVIQEISD